MDSTEKREQETASLKKIDDSFRKIVVVRKRIIPRHDNDGILYIGVEDSTQIGRASCRERV